MDLPAAITVARTSTVAILRYRLISPQKAKKNKIIPPKYSVSFGSGFCVVRNRFVVTAHHLLNDGKPRQPGDSFVALVVPDNGDPFFHFPVVGFPCERPDCDTAILELGPCSSPGISLPALPVSLAYPPDGTRVVTVGFPSPEVHGLSIDPSKGFVGGQFFLKSHANEGVLAAQYDIAGLHAFEFNVGWHHGESGGLVATHDAEVSVFTLMQHYRDVQTPHGKVAGPHRGVSLRAIEGDLRRTGARIV